MQNKNSIVYGNCLIISSVMMFVTMALHPAGGSIEHLQNISARIIITHSMALMSIPVALLGFWGLTKKLGPENILNMAAFITMSLGIFAVLCAAATNGLALPIFVNHYTGDTTEKLDSIKPVLNYNSSLNHAFDFIYIVASCSSIFCWSLVIIKTGLLPRWSGWLGLILSFLAMLSMILGFVFVDLGGFRVFVSGIALWMVIIGRQIRKSA